MAGDLASIPALSGNALAALNGIGEHESEEAEFATNGLAFIMSGVKLWVAIKKRKEV